MNARIVRFHQTGGPEVLKIETVDVPAPGPGEVRINVKALGLNRAEVMFRSGRYLEQPTFPARLGYEAAGIVESLGDGVQGLKVGEAVSTAPAFPQNQYGVYGELALVPATAVMKHPATLSWQQAAAVWMQYLTAYGALVSIADVKAGETVVIPAASSSVGIAAAQIVNMLGAIPIALTRSGKKRQALLDLGFKHVVALDEQDLVAEVRKLTRDQGTRVVFDPVGGPTVVQLTAAMAPRGILIEYGRLSLEPTPLPLFNILGKSLTVRGYVLFEITGDAAQLKLRRAIRRRRSIVRQACAGDLQDLPARADRRCASLSGIQRADREDRRDRVTRIGPSKSRGSTASRQPQSAGWFRSQPLRHAAANQEHPPPAAGKEACALGRARLLFDAFQRAGVRDPHGRDMHHLGAEIVGRFRRDDKGEHQCFERRRASKQEGHARRRHVVAFHLKEVLLAGQLHVMPRRDAVQDRKWMPLLIAELGCLAVTR